MGDMDQVLHLWRYTGGFEKIDQAKNDLWSDTVSLQIFLSNTKFLKTKLLLQSFNIIS